ncbi:MAG: ABC transporter permease [Treponema sp.]|jgi:ABC-2 type transport system permease protein|nr:ABC transporter permease [Treponema sp.]
MNFFSPKAAARRTMVLAGKELYSWINSPALYGITIFFLLFVTIWFYYLQRFFAMDSATLRPFFEAFPLAFILVIPVLTMKAWAEEKKLGSEEILFTMPFTELELVLGKFFSCFTLLLAMLVLTLPVPLTLLPLGYFDPGVIVAEYAGVVLLGASAAALGLFLSSVSKTQAAAFLGSAVVLMAIILVNNLTQNMPPSLAAFVNYISLSFHFESFARGLLDSRDIAFFLLTTGLFLFLNTQVLIFRKWS